MKKRLFMMVSIFLLLLQLMPLTALATSATTQEPEKPYEKIAAKNGKWYTRQMEFDGNMNLIFGYTGSYTAEGNDEIQFQINEKMILSSIVLPVQGQPAEDILIGLVNEYGDVYGDFSLYKQPVSSGNEGDIVNGYNTACIFTPMADLVLEPGSYSVVMEGAKSPGGAVLVKGYQFTAYQKYQEELFKWMEENGYAISETGGEPQPSDEGSEEPPVFPLAKDPLVSEPENFSGTFKVNFQAVKTATLMGPENSGESSFSLTDFELTVLKRDGAVELIGQYEKMPFSQRCEIVEETENTLVAKTNFIADASKIPGGAKITAEVLISFSKIPDSKEAVQISLTGTGLYERKASADRGEDYNTYDLSATGVRVTRELPIFVATALGATAGGGIGNIPGPDNVTQAAAGMLFPPLAGLAVKLLQDSAEAAKKAAEAKRAAEAKKAEKAKKAAEAKKSAKSRVHDRQWYKEKYPDLTDEQLAMLMLADAMGGTDNPDEGDADSVGDNEVSSEGNHSNGYDPDDQDFEVPDDSMDYEEVDLPEVDEPEQKSPDMSDKKSSEDQAETTPEKTAEEPAEPSTLTIKDPYTGSEQNYEKDPVTGEWVNTESGNALSESQYEEAQRLADKRDKTMEEQRADNKGADKSMAELQAQLKAKEADLQKFQDLAKKNGYGGDDWEGLNKHIKKEAIYNGMAKDAAEAKKQQFIGNTMEVGEKVATGVLAGADAAIDALGEKTGAVGKGIRVGYKVLKNTAGSVAEAAVDGKSLWKAGTIGAGKGISEAADDFISNPGVKAGRKVVTDAVEAGLKADNWEKAKEGVGKSIVNSAVDIGFGSVAGKLAPEGSSLKKTIGVQIGKNLTTEFVTKPAVDDLAKGLKTASPVKK